MSVREKELFSTIRSEGVILPTSFIRRIAEKATDIPGIAATDYHYGSPSELNEALSRAWNFARGRWKDFSSIRKGAAGGDTLTSETREKWLLPLLQELGYGRLSPSVAKDIAGKSYPISHFWTHLPIHLVGAGVPIDRTSKGVKGASRVSPHGLVQEYVNRDDTALWAFVSNGLIFRVLRDNLSLTKASYVEFDIEGMMDGEVYSDFVVFWLLCHVSRVEGKIPHDTLLEKWTRHSHEQGTRALDTLRDGVQRAIEELGRGFISHPSNRELREALAEGKLGKEDFYKELLRVVYRLIFLFVADDRDVLLAPQTDKQTKSRYLEFYSTKRLRRIALKVRGTKHTDHWQGLCHLFKALGSEHGCPELGLPPLGSFLWSHSACPNLSGAAVSNSFLLSSIRELSLRVDTGTRRVVDFKNLGSEELGSVYESLLELVPEVDTSSAYFELNVVAGNERKTTGSYYTPTSLITCLLDSALDPVLDEKCRSEDPEQAILSMKVCDPACGSGHFLIAAAHRIAGRLARARSGDAEPSPDEMRNALRDVIGHCIYGVDINPMAVELCKVSLWLEALEPGKPLSFLEHKIRPGNSLLGITPALLKGGIPDTAFRALPGDDKKAAAAFAKRNRSERESRGQQRMFSTFEPWLRLRTLASNLVELEAINDDTLDGIKKKQELYEGFVASSGYLYGQFFADSWVAPFFFAKTDSRQEMMTDDCLRRIEINPRDCSPSLSSRIQRISRLLGFFHWHLEFPAVFRDAAVGEATSSQTGTIGGFDVMIGNPPWEKFTISDEEWFASRNAEVAGTKGKSGRDDLIDDLAKSSPELHEKYLEAKRLEKALSTFCSRDSGTFPLTGFKEVNTYHLFAELCERLVARNGSVGLVLKSGIASADNCLPLFAKLTGANRVLSLFDFVNSKLLFPAVKTVERFCLFTFLGGESLSSSFTSATLCQDVAELVSDDRRFELSPEDVRTMSPISGACPLLKTSNCLPIMRRLYTNHPILGDKDSTLGGDCWNADYVTMFHMSNDSEHFRRLPWFESKGLKISRTRSFHVGDEEYLPLYEGKYLYFFNHRYGSFENVSEAKKYGRKASAPEPTFDQYFDHSYEIVPRYWFPKSRWLDRAREKGLRTDFQFLFRDVAGVYPDVRTAIGLLCPALPAGHSAPLLQLRPFSSESLVSKSYLLFCGLFCSLAFDYVVRNKLFSKHLALNALNDLPMPSPRALIENDLSECMSEAVLELSVTTESTRIIATAMGRPKSPSWSQTRRLLLMRVVDALSFSFYGMQEHEVRYVLSTFQTLQREEKRAYGIFLTAEIVLGLFRVIDAKREKLVLLNLLDEAEMILRNSIPTFSTK